MNTYKKDDRRAWFDRKTRSWVCQTVDESGNQVGDAHFCATSREVEAWFGVRALQPLLVKPTDEQKKPTAKPYSPSGSHPAEVRLTVLRETPPSGVVDTPERSVEYWRSVVETAPDYRTEQEQFVVFMLNTRRRVIGHQVVTIGVLDQVVVHPREVFRAAIIAGAAAIIVGHNHPSGDPMPSEADIRVTRELIRAGHLLKIELLDHVIVGERTESSKGWVSLRELGYFSA